MECTTTSAPSASGCCRYGEANVLSTTSSASASWASSASAAMSEIAEQRVGRRLAPHQPWSSGRIAARTASRSPQRHRRCSRPPSGPAPRRTAGSVPPYASSGISTWSPGAAERAEQAVLGRQPGGERQPAAPPSRAARHCSRAVRVGLADRLYSYPPRSPPTPSCLYVDVAWIGTLTAPVAGSGSCPAWMARVSKPLIPAGYRAVTDRRPPAGTRVTFRGVIVLGQRERIACPPLQTAAATRSWVPVAEPRCTPRRWPPTTPTRRNWSRSATSTRPGWTSTSA